MRADELVTLAMEQLETTSDQVLARALGLTGYSAPARVRRWRRGENEPNFDATMQLLEIVGLLREKPGRATRGAQARPAEEQLAELARTVTAGFEEIGKQLHDLQQRVPPQQASVAPGRSA